MANIKRLYGEVTRAKKAKFKALAAQFEANPRADDLLRLVSVFRRRAREDFRPLRRIRL